MGAERGLGRLLGVLVEAASGNWRKTTRTLSPYLAITCSMVGTTREQKGHWKSENSTMVTGASRALGGAVGRDLRADRLQHVSALYLASSAG